MISKKQAQTSITIFSAERQPNIVKTISAYTKSSDLIFRTLKKIFPLWHYPFRKRPISSGRIAPGSLWAQEKRRFSNASFRENENYQTRCEKIADTRVLVFINYQIFPTIGCSPSLPSCLTFLTATPLQRFQHSNLCKTEDFFCTIPCVSALCKLCPAL